MSATAEIITASVAVMGALGAAGRFVWLKIEARFSHIDEQLDECRTREERSQARRAVQLTVIELLWQEVQRLAPKAPVLVRAKKLLDELKTIDGET